MTISCVGCLATRAQPPTRSGRARLPRGWKILGGRSYCPACKTKAYALRTITIPIAGPVNGEWAGFREALRAGWSASTSCANWMTTELYRRDVRRQPGETKLAKMPSIYLYPEARVLFPDLPTTAIVSLEQELRARYRAQRHDVLWMRSRALASFRYPHPLPIPSNSWSLVEVGREWHLSFRLGDHRWTVRLRSGPEMRYQTAGLRQIKAGAAVAGTLSLYQVLSNRGDHRAEGAHPSTRVMVRIPAWFPRETQREASGHLCVRTSDEHFLVAGADDCAWVLNADHVRRWVVAFDRQRRRLVQDLKAERRTRDQKEGMLGRLSQLAMRQRHRIDTWTHEASRQVVNYAIQKRCAGISYDDAVQGYVRSFPWEALRQQIRDKAERAGLRFDYVTRASLASTDEFAVSGHLDALAT